MDKTIRDQFCEKVAQESELDMPTLLKIDEEFRAELTLEEFLKSIGDFKAALAEAPRRLEGTWHAVLRTLNIPNRIPNRIPLSPLGDMRKRLDSATHSSSE